jgi:hypothetical protein
MRPGRDEDDDVIEIHTLRKLVEQLRQYEAARLRSRNIAHRNRDPLTFAHESSEARSRNWAAQRVAYEFRLIWWSRRKPRFDDRRPVLGKIDQQIA